MNYTAYTKTPAKKSFVVKDPNAPASDAQKKMLLTVLGEREMTDELRATATDLINSALLKKSVQTYLGWLKGHPRKGAVVAPVAAEVAPVVAEVQKVVDGFGIYQGVTGTIYSFKLKKATGKGTWMRLVITTTEEPGDEWSDGETKVIKTGKLVWTNGHAARQDIENGGHKLTETQAEEFGKGHGFCIACGRLLTNVKSVDLGIGPICRGETTWA